MIVVRQRMIELVRISRWLGLASVDLMSRYCRLVVILSIIVIFKMKFALRIYLIVLNPYSMNVTKYF